MSSWLRAVKLYAKPKVATGSYYDMSSTTDVTRAYLELLGVYIYSRRLNEVCTIYEPNGFIGASIKSSPQLQVIKEVPEEGEQIQLESALQMLENLSFSQIQKYAASLFEYTPEFNRGILQALDKAAIRTAFDIAIHINDDGSGSSFKNYSGIISEYQKKSKKAKLNVYILANSYQTVLNFQKVCDPSWKISTLSKFPATDAISLLFTRLAEVQIFAVVEAAVLDFSFPIDRFIYIMQRNAKGYTFLREYTGTKWSINAPPPPVIIAPVPLPLPIAAPTPVVVEPTPLPLPIAAPTPVVVEPAPLPIAAPTPVEVEPTPLPLPVQNPRQTQKVNRAKPVYNPVVDIGLNAETT